MKYIPKESKLHYTAEWILIVESLVCLRMLPSSHYGTPHFKMMRDCGGVVFASWNLLTCSYNLIHCGHTFFCSFCAVHSPTLHNFITIITMFCYVAVINLLMCYVDFPFLKIYRPHIKAKFQPEEIFLVCRTNNTVYNYS